MVMELMGRTEDAVRVIDKGSPRFIVRIVVAWFVSFCMICMWDSLVVRYADCTIGTCWLFLARRVLPVYNR